MTFETHVANNSKDPEDEKTSVSMCYARLLSTKHLLEPIDDLCKHQRLNKSVYHATVPKLLNQHFKPYLGMFNLHELIVLRNRYKAAMRRKAKLRKK